MLIEYLFSNTHFKLYNNEKTIRLKLYGENHRDVQSLRQIIRDVEAKMDEKQ